MLPQIAPRYTKKVSVHLNHPSHHIFKVNIHISIYIYIYSNHLNFSIHPWRMQLGQRWFPALCPIRAPSCIAAKPTAPQAPVLKLVESTKNSPSMPNSLVFLNSKWPGNYGETMLTSDEHEKHKCRQYTIYISVDDIWWWLDSCHSIPNWVFPTPESASQEQKVWGKPRLPPAATKPKAKRTWSFCPTSTLTLQYIVLKPGWLSYIWHILSFIMFYSLWI